MKLTFKMAEKALKKLNLKIVSNKKINQYNKHRFDNMNFNHEIVLNDWIDQGSWLEKEFYVYEKGERNYRKALFTIWQGEKTPRIILENWNGDEVINK